MALADAKDAAAVEGHSNLECYSHDANHAFARVGGMHWDVRSVTIATAVAPRLWPKPPTEG
jgi:hypothetical protein